MGSRRKLLGVRESCLNGTPAQTGGTMNFIKRPFSKAHFVVLALGFSLAIEVQASSWSDIQTWHGSYCSGYSRQGTCEIYSPELIASMKKFASRNGVRKVKDYYEGLNRVKFGKNVDTRCYSETPYNGKDSGVTFACCCYSEINFKVEQ